jgi:hypothetical protein
MSECPYEETIINEDTDTEVVNVKYIAWHEGYEAHKHEIAGYVTDLKIQLEGEIRKARQLQIDLIVKYYESMTELVLKEKPKRTE